MVSLGLGIAKEHKTAETLVLSGGQAGDIEAGVVELALVLFIEHKAENELFGRAFAVAREHSFGEDYDPKSLQVGVQDGGPVWGVKAVFDALKTGQAIGTSERQAGTVFEGRKGGGGLELLNDFKR